MEYLLEVQQPGRLLFGKFFHRNPSPAGDDISHIFICDQGEIGGTHLLLPLFFQARQLLFDLPLPIAQLRSLLELLIAHRRLLLRAHSAQLLLDLLQIGGGGIATDADPRSSLVDKIDGLIGQKAIGDIAIRKFHRRFESFVGDLDLMMRLIAIAQPLQDGKTFLLVGLADNNRLKAPLQGGVFFNMLAVLIERRRTDALQLTAGQRRLEDIGGIDGPLGSPRPDDRMQLIDENHDVAGLTQLHHQLAQPLLEFAAVFCPCHHRGQLDCDQPFAAEDLGYIILDDPLG